MSVRNASWSLISLCILIVSTASTGCRTSPEAREAKYLKRGEALLAKKDYPRALLEFRNAMQVMPKDAEPYYQSGLAHMGSGNLTNAARAFKKASELDPKHLGAQLKIAEILASSRDQNLVEQAASRLLGVFGASPSDPEAIDTLALTEWKLGKPEEAAQRLEEALKKFPTHLATSVQLAKMKFRAKDWPGAEAILKKAVADAPQSPEAALALGEFYTITKQPQKAEAELLRAAKLDPTNASVLIALAGAQASLQKMEAAEQTYRKVSSLPDKTYKPLHAMFLYQSGKREAAAAELWALFKSDPNDRVLRTRLVTIYIGMNRISEAEGVLAEALKRNDRDTDALLQRAELRLRGGKAAEAEADLKQVLHFSPDSATAHFLLAGVYAVGGQANRQQQELQESLRLNPDLLLARIILANSLLAAKQSKTALDIIDQAPESQRKTVPWMLAHNWTVLSLGEVKKAKDDIDKILQQGRLPEAVFQNAVIRFMEQDYAGARTDLEDLVKRGITEPNVIQLLMQTFAVRQEIAKGVQRLEEIAAAKPQSASLQYQLGAWQKRSGNIVAARKAWEKAKAADSKFTQADLALAQMDLAEGHGGEARQRMSAVIAANPKDVNALLLGASADEVIGDRPSMIAKYRAVLNLDQSNLFALNNLAYTLAPDHADEALKFAQQAAEIAPDSAAVQDTLGWIYYHKGLYSMAVKYLKTAVDHEATPRRQFHLGMTYIKTGDEANGRNIVRQALAKDPSLSKTEQGW